MRPAPLLEPVISVSLLPGELRRVLSSSALRRCATHSRTTTSQDDGEDEASTAPRVTVLAASMYELRCTAFHFLVWIASSLLLLRLPASRLVTIICASPL